MKAKKQDKKSSIAVVCGLTFTSLFKKRLFDDALLSINHRVCIQETVVSEAELENVSISHL